MTSDPLPFDDASAVFRLSDGRVARVAYSHHASPAERWRMWRTLRLTKREWLDEDGNKRKMSRRDSFRMNRMFLMTVLNPNCKACWYEVTNEAKT